MGGEDKACFLSAGSQLRTVVHGATSASDGRLGYFKIQDRRLQELELERKIQDTGYRIQDTTTVRILHTASFDSRGIHHDV